MRDYKIKYKALTSKGKLQPKKILIEAGTEEEAIEFFRKNYQEQFDKIEDSEQFNNIIEDLDSYDKIIVAFSGGKDSIACFLYLLDLGVPKYKIELWHHSIDGREGSTLMDWNCTESYCKAFAKAFDVPLYFSWKVDGFEGEMMRFNSRTQPTKFEIPADNPDEDNLIECGIEVKQSGGIGGKESTRMKFPQKTADLSTRWCSAYLKIGVCTAAINNQDRFHGKKTLVISGERAQESSARSTYFSFEADPSDRRNGKMKRHVDRARPIHKWDEKAVWDIIAKYKVNMHPAYRLGFGRLSCMCCVFASKNQWSSIKKLNSEKFAKIAQLEKEFKTTIDRKLTVEEMAELGNSYEYDAELGRMSQTSDFNEEIILDEWELPSGAFGESNGPT